MEEYKTRHLKSSKLVRFWIKNIAMLKYLRLIQKKFIFESNLKKTRLYNEFLKIKAILKWISVRKMKRGPYIFRMRM